MHYSRGSLWHKWDLHVHTPESIVSNYPGDKEIAWERFLEDIESLPEEYKVIGVNDYIFLDGYRRICEERNKGRLENIDLFLPVIELRLNSFGGSRSKLSRVNFHVIFSNELEPEIIEKQFINALKAKYTLSPRYEEAASEWSGVVNKKSLEDLGNLIIESVPEEERCNYQSPLQEGFNNINFSFDTICDILERPYFKEKNITAIGKTEWYDIKWNDHSIADKKKIINSVDIVFISSDTQDNYVKAKESLEKAEVNCHLLDCSDAHHLSSSGQKDRISNCMTWIKGDTTFHGLCHALNKYDFNDRVFVGVEPAVFKRVMANGSQFIDSINIIKKPDSKLDEEWFNTNLTLNPGLVAIIGNKGSGKSALAETISILGNAYSKENFSFYTLRKFCQKKNNRANHFEGTLIWANGKSNNMLLSDGLKNIEDNQIKFIPQNFLEKICNELPKGEETEFDKELKSIIYSHVDKKDRLGISTLDDLIYEKTTAIRDTIEQYRKELYDVNIKINDLEKKSKPEYKNNLRNSLDTVREKLKDIKKAKPKEVPPPEKDNEDQGLLEEIDKVKKEKDKIIIDINKIEEDLSNINLKMTKISNIKELIKSIERQYNNFLEKNSPIATDLEFDLNSVIKLNINWTKIEQVEEALCKIKCEKEELINEDTNDNLITKKEKLFKKEKQLIKKLNAPQQEYENYLSELREWKQQRKNLIGAKNIPETALYYRNELHELNLLFEQIQNNYNLRNTLTKNIHNKINYIADTYRELYEPIQKYIGSHEVNEEIQLTFSTEIIDQGFRENFFEFINRSYSGSFYGVERSTQIVDDLLAEHDFNNTEDIISFIDKIIDKLKINYQAENSKSVDINNQLKSGKEVNDLYDYIYGLSYLTPRYSIKFSGKYLYELSPGEKGTLLLLFYLLVDKSQIPLIIDQPEDNLDNETVYYILVKCIKEARLNRQIILVTHNPNLAVVCDADQVIVSSMNKESGNSIMYCSGGIENPEINRYMIDILEGTRPAFDNRNTKYYR